MQDIITSQIEPAARVWSLDDLRGWQEGVMATVGMFDGVHRGHRQIVAHLLDMARRRNQRPVVVTFKNHPRVALGKTDNDFRMLTTNEERVALLSQLGIKEVVEIAFTPTIARQTACEFLAETLCDKLKVKTLLLGYDNMFGSKAVNDFYRLPEVASIHGVTLLHDTALRMGEVEVSSSQIRTALKTADLARANEMLGYNYFVSGEVVHGRHVGRTIGFPTANVDMTGSMKALPADGVYAVSVWLNGVQYRGMANVGAQPTFGLSNPTLEVNIFNFDQEIYGEQLTVCFDRRLRPVRQFANLHELVAQLEADRKEAQL